MGIENSGVPTFNENLSKSFKLADSFRRGEVFGEKSGEEAIKANQKVTEILNSSFQVGFESEGQYNNISQYESVANMIYISKPEGGRTPRSQENAKNALFEVGLALSQNKEVLKAATEGTDELNKILPSNLHEIQPYILSVILTNGKDDVQGQELVSELVDLFKLKNRTDRNPSVYKDDYSQTYKKITVKLDDIYDDLDSKSRIDGTEGRIETMRGYVFDINEENNSSDMTEKMVEAAGKIIEGTDETEDEEDEGYNSLNPGKVYDNLKNADSNERVSPYEVTKDYFVKMLFDYESPRLFPATPSEWFKRLPEIEQYKLKLQQRLVEGVGYKLGTKDISPEKARENKIYNFSTQELKLIYEMPGVEDSMESFVNDLFEFYSEDGKEFLRIKQCKEENLYSIPFSDSDLEKRKKLEKKGKMTDKQFSDYLYMVDKNDPNHYVKRRKDNCFVIDPLTNIRLGNATTETKIGDKVYEGGSFENYREEMYLKMAMKRLNPEMSDDYINNNWDIWHKNQLKNSVDNYHQQQNELKIKQIEQAKKGIRFKQKRELTDAEVEYKWLVDNALEEKRAVATAWNFLFVGNIVESADVYRQLKPTQVTTDKIRTMMMPLEKFLQKIGIHEESITGKEEGFGGSLSLWVRKRFEEEESEGRHDLRDKLRYAESHNRSEMTPEQRMWRIMPKRVMWSFVDDYKVKTNEGQMTMSKALIEREKIKFIPNDLDVFVDTRDTWDEVMTIMAPLIGKGDVDLIKKPEQYISAVHKLQGVVTNINKNDKVYNLFTKNPEYYAWLVANSVGLETNLDIPILKRSALDKDTHYFVNVQNIADNLSLDEEQTRVFNKILNAEGYGSSKFAIMNAESRKDSRFKKR